AGGVGGGGEGGARLGRRGGKAGGGRTAWPPEPPRGEQRGSQLLRPSDLRYVQSKRVGLDGVGASWRRDLHHQHGLPVAAPEQRSVQASLLLAPPHLPRSVRDLEEAGDGR